MSRSKALPAPALSLLRSAPRVALGVCFLLFVPGLTEQFEAPKAAALLVAAAGVLGAAVASGPALWRIRWHPLDAAVLSWLAAEFLATAFSALPRLSLIGEPAQRDSLLTSVSLAGIYLAARLSTRGAGDALGTLIVALAAAAAASLYAIAQALGLDPLAWTQTSGFVGLAVRPFGTFGHPNLLGVAASAGLATAAPLALLLSGRRRAISALAALPLAAATVLTLSRAAWLGALCGIVLAGSLAWLSGASAGPTRRALLIGGAVLLAGAGLLWAGGWEAILHQRLQDLLAPAGGTGRTRLEIWKAALAAWAARPWLGHGPDCFALVFPSYQTPEYWSYEWGGLPLHAHSVYLQTLATRGLLGAAAASACAVAAVLAARSAWLAGGDSRRTVPALAGILGALGVTGAFNTIGVGGALLLVTAAAILAALAAGGSAPSPRAPVAAVSAQRAVSGRRWAAAPVLAGGALSLVAFAWCAIDVSASRSDRRGQDLVVSASALGGEARRLTLEHAAQSYASAASRAPRDDGIARRHAVALFHLSAFAREPLAVLDEAEREARRASLLAPLRSVNHQCLGAVLMARARLGDAGRLAEAEAAYARSLELAPRNGIAMAELARAEMDLGRPEAALQAAARATALYPAEGVALYQTARAQHALGERDRARDTLERAAAADWHGQESDRRDALRLLEALRADPTARSRRGTP